MSRQVMNPSEAAREAEAQRFRRDRELADLQSVMGTPEGRRFIWRQLSSAGIFNGGFVQNGSEQYYLAGKRAIGLILLNEVKANFHQAYQVMEAEAFALQALEQFQNSHAVIA